MNNTLQVPFDLQEHALPAHLLHSQALRRPYVPEVALADTKKP